MVHIFNRKELLATYSVKLQADARAALEGAGIDYSVSTLGPAMRNAGAGPIAVDRFGENPAANCEYKIFVRKKDYQMALQAVNQRGRQA